MPSQIRGKLADAERRPALWCSQTGSLGRRQPCDFLQNGMHCSVSVFCRNLQLTIVITRAWWLNLGTYYLLTCFDLPLAFKLNVRAICSDRASTGQVL